MKQDDSSQSKKKRIVRKNGTIGSKRGRGNPTKCTPRTVKRLCQALNISVPIGDACKYAGINHTTYKSWINRAEHAMEVEGLDPEIDLPPNPLPGHTDELPALLEQITSERERPYVYFLCQIKRALAEEHVKLAAFMHKAAAIQSKEGDHRGALAILERRHAQHWGRQDRLDQRISGADGSGLVINLAWPGQAKVEEEKKQELESASPKVLIEAESTVKNA